MGNRFSELYCIIIKIILPFRVACRSKNATLQQLISLIIIDVRQIAPSSPGIIDNLDFRMLHIINIKVLAALKRTVTVINPTGSRALDLGIKSNAMHTQAVFRCGHDTSHMSTMSKIRPIIYSGTSNIDHLRILF